MQWGAPIVKGRTRPSGKRGEASLTLCWLLGTSVLEIGMVHAIERASLLKHVRGEYNQQRPFCSYVPARRLFSGRRGSIRAFRVHLDQATSISQLSRAPRTFFGLDQTSDDLLCAWNARRSDQK